MSKISARREAAADIVDTVERYHAALGARNFGTIGSFFSETAVYVSDIFGVLEGRDAIATALGAYFADFVDRAVEHGPVESISPRAVRSVWKLRGTSATTGQTLIRAGEETAFLDQDGFIEKVIVRDCRH